MFRRSIVGLVAVAISWGCGGPAEENPAEDEGAGPSCEARAGDEELPICTPRVEDSLKESSATAGFEVFPGEERERIDGVVLAMTEGTLTLETDAGTVSFHWPRPWPFRFSEGTSVVLRRDADWDEVAAGFQRLRALRQHQVAQWAVYPIESAVCVEETVGCSTTTGNLGVTVRAKTPFRSTELEAGESGYARQMGRRECRTISPVLVLV